MSSVEEPVYVGILWDITGYGTKNDRMLLHNVCLHFTPFVWLSVTHASLPIPGRLANTRLLDDAKMPTGAQYSVLSD
jgi:hypothetical protein